MKSLTSPTTPVKSPSNITYSRSTTFSSCLRVPKKVVPDNVADTVASMLDYGGSLTSALQVDSKVSTLPTRRSRHQPPAYAAISAGLGDSKPHHSNDHLKGNSSLSSSFVGRSLRPSFLQIRRSPCPSFPQPRRSQCPLFSQIRRSP